MNLVSRSAAGLAAIAVALTLAACSAGGGNALPSGLTTPMNAPGAQLHRVEALSLVNSYRGTQRAAPLRGDTLLDATASSLAAAYAKSGTPPALPAGVLEIRLSAGYTTFAETFSGWRAIPGDAAALADPRASRAGLGVAYEANSQHGVYWVLLLDD